MKKAMKVLGITLMILGALAYIASMGMEESSKPTQVKVGYGTVDNFVVTNSGYIGGMSSQEKKSVTMIEGIGISSMIGGVVLLLVSRAFPEE